LRVGLSQRILYHKNRAYDAVDHGWYRYLRRHELVFVANDPYQDFHKLADDLDVLVITGGDDSAARRLTEIRLSTLIMQSLKPVIGICHGAFLLTDLLGGQVSACSGHMDTDHEIDYMGIKKTVNSFHSQNISRLHSTGQCLAVDHEGHCEAWADKNIFGIVWHPERMPVAWIPPEISNILQIS
jgi:gamma-glutamyl-gamma-aminobutyrate hydrolase PuuD